MIRHFKMCAWLGVAGAAAAADSADFTISGSVQRSQSARAAAGVRVTLFDLYTLRPVTTLTDDAGAFTLHVKGPIPVVATLPLQNYPNPFNPATTIPFELDRAAFATIEVFDLLGQLVRTLARDWYAVGRHTVVWDATDESRRAVASGVYIYRLTVDGVALEARRMILVDGPHGFHESASPSNRVRDRSNDEAAATYGITVAGAGIQMLVVPELSLDASTTDLAFTVRQASSAGSAKVTGVAVVAEAEGILGDVTGDGTVTITDALVVATYGLDNSVQPPEGGDMSLGDVNGDGRIDISDALIIATFSVDPSNPHLPEQIGDVLVPEVPTYTFSGFVRNRAGEALQGAQVRLGPLATVTDADGFYQLVVTETVQSTIIVELADYAQHAAALSLAGEDLAYSVELKPQDVPTSTAVADADVIFTGGSVTLRGGDSIDPSGRGLSYHWASVPTNPVGVEFPFNDSGEAFAVTVTLTARGEYRFRLVVDNGLASSDPDTVLVIANSPPASTITSPQNGTTFEAGQTIALQGQGEDAETGFLNPERLTWHLDTNTEIGTGSVAPLTDLEVGAHQISLVVTDDFGAADTTVITIDVVEAPPALSLTAVSGDGQIVPIYQESDALVVAIVDELLQGAPGRPVALTIVSGGGELSANSRITDAGGELATTLTPTSMGDIVVQATTTAAAETLRFHLTPAAVIEDGNLETAIRNAIAKPSGDIVAADIADLVDLDASQQAVQSLGGVELLPAIESFNAGLNQIVDLAPLALATTLTELRLGSNQIADLSALATLTSLTTLALQDNQIADVSGLSGLTTLRKLTLWGNVVDDIASLAGLTGLEDLELSNNQIANAGPLAALTNLIGLDLSENEIADLSPLAGMWKLAELDLSENAVSDVGSLAGMVSLTDLNLSDNKVTAIAALAGLAELRDLDLNDNDISDVSAITGMGELASLNLKRNKITDIEPLVNNLGLGAGDDVDLRNNPLNQDAVNVHIPALESRGVTVRQ